METLIILDISDWSVLTNDPLSIRTNC